MTPKTEAESGIATILKDTKYDRYGKYNVETKLSP